MDYAVIFAILTILTAQFSVLCGIFLRLGGVHEAIEHLKQRMKEMEDKHEKCTN